VNAAIVTVLALAVFVPLRYVYPSRTPTLRGLTVGLGLLWGAVLVWVLCHLETAPRALVAASLLYPAYYFALSIALDVRARLS
jgi:phosphatidylcholine synthase